MFCPLRFRRFALPRDVGLASAKYFETNNHRQGKELFIVMFRPWSFSVIRTSDENECQSRETQGVADEGEVGGVTVTVST